MTQDWHTIDTAPYDGESVLLYIPDARHKKDLIHSGQCRQDQSGARFWIIGNRFHYDVGIPTHWMPLPAPPTLPGRPQETRE